MLFLLVIFSLAAGSFAVDTPIVLFSDGIVSRGNLGNRSATSMRCAQAASARGLSCGTAFMFIAYWGDTIPSECVPGNPYASISQSVPVTANTANGTTIARNWTSLFTAIVNPFSVITGITSEYWTGMNVTGEPNYWRTCSNWTSSGFLSGGLRGSSSSTSAGQWLYNGNNVPFCSDSKATVCVCAPPSPALTCTAAPTAVPTAFPTHVNTTSTAVVASASILSVVILATL